MNRITLNVILRTIFGADGTELEELREIVPPYMKLGQLLAFVPSAAYSGPGATARGASWTSSAGHSTGSYARSSIRAEADPRLGERTDILALLLRSRHDDGIGMSRLRYLRRTVDPRRCGPRNHSISTGLGV